MNPILVPAVSTAESRVFVLTSDRGVRSHDFSFVLEAVDDTGHAVTRRTRFVAPEGGSGAR
jgi:hypothetical protein